MSIDTQAAKQRLQALKDEYQTRIDKINQRHGQDAEEMQQHFEDQALIVSADDTRQSLKVEAEMMLTKVQDALSRIDNDTYGYCSTCGEEIDSKRLEAVPYAAQCIMHAG